MTATDSSILSSSGGLDSISGVDALTVSGTSGADVLNTSAFSGNADLSGFAGADQMTAGLGDDVIVA